MRGIIESLLVLGLVLRWVNCKIIEAPKIGKQIANSAIFDQYKFFGDLFEFFFRIYNYSGNRRRNRRSYSGPLLE